MWPKSILDAGEETDEDQEVLLRGGIGWEYVKLTENCSAPRVAAFCCALRIGIPTEITTIDSRRVEIFLKGDKLTMRSLCDAVCVAVGSKRFDRESISNPRAVFDATTGPRSLLHLSVSSIYSGGLDSLGVRNTH
jgi:hypothetical protein